MHDWELLREYAATGSQEAFSRLVAKYVDLVYFTCLREVNDASLTRGRGREHSLPAIDSSTCIDLIRRQADLYRSANFI